MPIIEHGNYTELVHPGENISIEKGVISSSGSGSGGGEILTMTYDGVIYTLNASYSDISAFIDGGVVPSATFSYHEDDADGIEVWELVEMYTVSGETYPYAVVFGRYDSTGSGYVARVFGATTASENLTYEP